jgi:hypothetical protein
MVNRGLLLRSCLLQSGIQVVLDTFTAIAEDLVQFLATAIEPFQHLLGDLSDRGTYPDHFADFYFVEALKILDLIGNHHDPLSDRVVCIHEHLAEHVIGCGIERINILLVLGIKFVQLFVGEWLVKVYRGG